MSPFAPSRRRRPHLLLLLLSLFERVVTSKPPGGTRVRQPTAFSAGSVPASSGGCPSPRRPAGSTTCSRLDMDKRRAVDRQRRLEVDAFARYRVVYRADARLHALKNVEQALSQSRIAAAQRIVQRPSPRVCHRREGRWADSPVSHESRVICIEIVDVPHEADLQAAPLWKPLMRDAHGTPAGGPSIIARSSGPDHPGRSGCPRRANLFRGVSQGSQFYDLPRCSPISRLLRTARQGWQTTSSFRQTRLSEELLDDRSIPVPFASCACIASRQDCERQASTFDESTNEFLPVRYSYGVAMALLLEYRIFGPTGQSVHMLHRTRRRRRAALRAPTPSQSRAKLARPCHIRPAAGAVAAPGRPFEILAARRPVPEGKPRDLPDSPIPAKPVARSGFLISADAHRTHNHFIHERTGRHRRQHHHHPVRPPEFPARLGRDSARPRAAHDRSSTCPSSFRRFGPVTGPATGWSRSAILWSGRPVPPASSRRCIGALTAARYDRYIQTTPAQLCKLGLPDVRLGPSSASIGADLADWR